MFIKTKENEESIYEIQNAWLRNRRSILAFMKKEIKDRERERERAIEPFLIIFL